MSAPSIHLSLLLPVRLRAGEPGPGDVLRGLQRALRHLQPPQHRQNQRAAEQGLQRHAERAPGQAPARARRQVRGGARGGRGGPPSISLPLTRSRFSPPPLSAGSTSTSTTWPRPTWDGTAPPSRSGAVAAARGSGAGGGNKEFRTVALAVSLLAQARAEGPALSALLTSSGRAAG